MKYYVQSGQIKTVIDSASRYEAAFHGLRKALVKDDTLLPGKFVYCSERGFYDESERPDDVNDDAEFFPADQVLKDLGIRENFDI